MPKKKVGLQTRHQHTTLSFDQDWKVQAYRNAALLHFSLTTIRKGNSTQMLQQEHCKLDVLGLACCKQLGEVCKDCSAQATNVQALCMLHVCASSAAEVLHIAFVDSSLVRRYRQQLKFELT